MSINILKNTKKERKVRYTIVDNDFMLYIVDNSLIEDKHEGHINDIYELCEKLNEYDEYVDSLNDSIGLMSLFILEKGHTIDEFNEFIVEKWKDE